MEINQDAKDLCTLILQENPDNRPELKQILEHKFFTVDINQP